MVYSISHQAIVFLPQIDSFNGFETIANDWRADKVVKIKGVGYRVLYFIYQKEKVTRKDILTEFSTEDPQEIEKFLNMMVDKRILIEK